jgi:hypothetical protein
MNNDVISMLGMSLDEVAAANFILSLNEKPEISQIEDRFYMELSASGLSFDANMDRRVKSVFLHSAGYNGYQGYAGTLPKGLTFSDSREAVRARLGKPSDSGGGKFIAFFGIAPMWDRFDQDSFCLHVQYANGEKSIELVTIMGPDAVPQ